MIVEYLFSPISGAVIGYFTNWLAIKMLFRPHKEIRVFNRALPFTPGLIPKERLRLSKKVAETVETYLLTPEVLINEFLSDNAMSGINNLMDHLFDSIHSSDMDINGLLHSMLKDNHSPIMEKAETYVTEQLAHFLRSESFRKEILSVLDTKAPELGPAIGKTLPVLVKSLRPYFMRSLTDTLRDQESIENAIQGFLQQNTDGEDSHAQRLMGHIKEYAVPMVLDGVPKLTSLLKKTLDNNPDLEKTFQTLIEKIIEQNFGFFIGSFINQEKIYNNIKKSIFEYLEKEENQRLLALKAEELVGSLFDHPDIPAISEKLASFAQERLTDDLIGQCLDKLEQYAEKAEQVDVFALITKAEPDFQQKLHDFLDEKLEHALSSEAGTLSAALVSKAFGNLQRIKIAAIVTFAGGEEKLKSTATKLARLALEKDAVFLVERINVKKMVEEKINEFEVDEAEKIILSVVNRELNAITVVGGVLGFVIGLTSFVPRLLGLW